MKSHLQVCKQLLSLAEHDLVLLIIGAEDLALH